jgi:hypothetical protein
MIVGPVASARMVTTPVTAYANAGGQGNRTATIAVSINWTPPNVPGNNQAAVDGVVSNAFDTPAGGAVAGERIVFDMNGLGGPRFINEATMDQNGNIGITGRYEYSFNGSVWVPASSNVSILGQFNIVTACAMPPEGARYFSWVAVSGSYGAGAYYQEFRFKIAPGAT